MIISIVIIAIAIVIIMFVVKSYKQEKDTGEYPLVTTKSFVNLDLPINLATAKLLYCSFMEYYNITYNVGEIAEEIKYKLEEFKEEMAFLKEEIRDLKEEKKLPLEEIKTLKKELMTSLHDESAEDINDEIKEYQKEIDIVDSQLKKLKEKFDRINAEYKNLKLDKTNFLINHINTEIHGEGWEALVGTLNIIEFDNPET